MEADTLQEQIENLTQRLEHSEGAAPTDEVEELQSRHAFKDRQLDALIALAAKHGAAPEEISEALGN